MRNPLQLARVLTGVTRLALDLKRLDDVIKINDALMKLAGPEDIRQVVDDFRRAPAGAEALQTRHRLGRVDLHALAATPAHTLGGAYGRFMLERRLMPESLPDVRAGSDIEYFLAHIYETHDLWHVVTGFDTDETGETALQAFYLAQERAYLPFFALSAILLNTAFFAYDKKHERLDAISEGWLLGKRAKKLVGIDWRKHLERPLLDVRRELALLPAETQAADLAS